ncbi:unnamed protein product [Dovyalis caffra]|uniref:Uncharacterized protein n=1 Tax=Dovyalis caffra TaxID=77055 RepID=A0AAV1S099_9ROSI|nr:unnamed protein product [Dovyalis caffra]
MALLSVLFLLYIYGALSASALSICPKESALFMYDIQSQCPVSISPNSPLQVSWVVVELSHRNNNEENLDFESLPFLEGLEPVQHFTKDDCTSTESHEKFFMQPEDIIKREPYLVLATLFLFLRVLLYVSPKVLSHLKAFYACYVPHFNLEIFGETSQLFGRILHMIDVRRIWTKLRICKTRNFHERAKNCRVWASSLASVSLGESSPSARSQS